METNKERYFNFPIQLLKGFIDNPIGSLNEIHRYSIYENSLKLYKGSELERFKESADFFIVTFHNIENSFDEAKEIYHSIPINSPKVGLNLSIFWDFYKNDKTEFDKICLLGFLGIKSILGTKAFFKLTNKNWLSRMNGNSKEVEYYSELSNEIIKYANEYQLKKIKRSLQNNWSLVTYSRFTRGFYVSFSMSQKDLIMIAEKNRISTKEKQRKAKEKEIVKEVLEQLNRTRP